MKFSKVKVGDDIQVRRSIGKLDKSHIEEVAKEYRFVYKCSKCFRRVEHNEVGSYPIILLSNEDYTDAVKFLKLYDYWLTYAIDFKKVKTLYKIKEKIDEI